MTVARPFISAALGDLKEAPGAAAAKGYAIGGSIHSPGCRCRACRVVRMRCREKLLLKAFLNAGGSYVADAAGGAG